MKPVGAWMHASSEFGDSCPGEVLRRESNHPLCQPTLLRGSFRERSGIAYTSLVLSVPEKRP